MAANEDVPVDIPYDVPTPARIYGWALGSKDNFEVDRRFMLKNLPAFPEMIDVARQNRLFLYRAVRYLARDAGIRQFLDMGCGLPADDNVHQVARRFAPDARVVYVDIDPIVLVHARALLAGDGSTVVITADMRDQEALLEHPDVRRLIDFDEPLAVLFLSVGHHLVDADDPRGVLRTVIERAVPGSHLAFTQIVCSDRERAADMDARSTAAGLRWQTRDRAEVDALLPAGLEPVEPGLVDVGDWRPDPDQPPLAPVPAELMPYANGSSLGRAMNEYGGVLRKP
ncbi:S-adenosyl methyltransferase [Actinomadura pelletieri DSM 43383]|uniref:S-adenosyl methyltransferase n=1 Tax=Actinomadura pelletieri DSM 43383 TaxID=1120940 RepID=A0A495QKY8_9ACTN|nr:SAM-dependent methyltransferase [Actinomadura pelletieri]RKS73214.1 S-adenosyl methyltransferase [Actinomadura pelletieri DSM 43383]